METQVFADVPVYVRRLARPFEGRLRPRACWVAIPATLLAWAVAITLSGPLGLSWGALVSFPFGVLAAAWYGGTAAGLIAATLSTFCIAFSFLHPIDSLAVASPADRLALGLFLMTSMVLSTLVGTSQHTRRQLNDVNQTLRLSESRYRLLFENNPEPMWIYDAGSGAVLAANEAACSTYGYRKTDLVGLQIGCLFDPEEARRFDWRTVRGEPTPWRHRKKDGVSLYVEASSTPIDWLGGPARLLVIHDLTDRRKAEESLVQLSNELRQALDVAHRASSAKDRFLSFVSHELRTPLTSMLLAVAALEARDRLSPEKRAKAIQVIRRNVEIEARFVEQLLDMSSIANGDFVLAPSPVEVMDMVRRAIGSCGQAACAREVAVTANMATPLFVAFADGVRLQQAVLTILNTAIDVVSDGGMVHLWTDVRPGKVFEMGVRAEPIRPGMGDVARLFDPFEPIEGSQAAVRLALAVAKRVVDGSGGTVHASDAEAGEQRAATFVVRLPAAPAPEPIGLR